MPTRDMRRVVPFCLLGVGACSNGTEPPSEPPVTITGVVSQEGGGPLPTTVEVSSVVPSGQLGVGGEVDLDGSYRLVVSGPLACASRIVAYVPATPFPLESDIGYLPPSGRPDCSGTIPGPELVVPRPDTPPDTARVVGTVTAAGTPVAATVTLSVVSYVIGRFAVATTATDSLGEYELLAEVPGYYCGAMEVTTVPVGNVALWPVSGCSSSLVDIDLSK